MSDSSEAKDDSVGASSHPAQDDSAGSNSARTDFSEDRVSEIVRFISCGSLCLSLAIFFSGLWRNRWIPALSTDSLVYHLTIPAKWTQIGLLNKFDIPFHDGTAIHSPLLTETILYFLMSLAGNDAFTWLVQPFFYLFLIYLFYQTVRLLELTPSLARLLTALLILFAPFFRSAQIINSEMVMTTGTALFTFGLVLSTKRWSAGQIAAAIGVALMASSKTIGIVYAVLGISIWIAFLAIQFRKAKADSINENSLPGRSLAIATLAIAGLIMLGGAYFPLRNWLTLGNPLYPATVTLAGIPVLSGLYSMSVFIDHGWSPDVLVKLLFHDQETFAPKFHTATFLWLGWLGMPVAALTGRLKQPERPLLLLFWFYPLVSVVVYFLFIPFWREHRLLCPVYYLLWCGLATSLVLLLRGASDRVSKALQITAAGIYAFYVMTFLVFDEVPMLLVATAIISGVIIANFPRSFGLFTRFLPALPLLGIVLGWLTSSWWYEGYLAERRMAKEHFYPLVYEDLGEAWSGLRAQTEQAPSTIAYSGTALIYPLFGDAFQNRVVHIPIHADDRPSPVELTSNGLIYLQLARHRRKSRDVEYWLEGLRESGAKYLLLVQDEELDGVDFELQVARDHPEWFTPAYRSDRVFVFALTEAFSREAAEFN